MAQRPRLNLEERNKRKDSIAAIEGHYRIDVNAPENAYLHLTTREWVLDFDEDIRDDMFAFLTKRRIKTLGDFRYWQFDELLLGQADEPVDVTMPSEKVSNALWKKSLECGVIWHSYYDPDQDGESTVKKTLKVGREWFKTRQDNRGNVPIVVEDKAMDLRRRRLLAAQHQDKMHILMLPVDAVPNVPVLRFAKEAGCSIVAELAAKTKEEHIANGLRKGLLPHMIHGLKKINLTMGLFQDMAKNLSDVDAGKDVKIDTPKPVDKDVVTAQKTYKHLFGFDLKAV